MCHERRGLILGYFYIATKDKRVDTSQESWGQKGFGLLGWRVGSIHSKEKNLMTSPVTQSHPSCTQRSLSTAQDSEGDNGEPGSGDVTKFTPGCGSGNWYTRTKENSELSLQEPGSA